MAEPSDEDVDMAYKYPFSSAARAVVASINPGFSMEMLERGRIRLEEALSRRALAYRKTNMRSVKIEHVVSYLYSRMLVSALKNREALQKYADAESRRSTEALGEDNDRNSAEIAKELGIDLRPGQEFGVPFADFLSNKPSSTEFALVHQELDGGFVYLDKYKAIGVVRASMIREIMKTLPIPLKDLPREVVEYAKKVTLPERPARHVSDEGRHSWIALLLEHPIPDVRHRTVNLILAPYLINVKGMGEEDAVKMIMAYIQRCKEIDPNTNVNESYVRYQCHYAKSKGSRPLSLAKAKELLGNLLNF